MIKELQEIIKKVEVEKKVLAKSRDTIRDYLMELEGLVFDADCAVDDLYDARTYLESAADTLSKEF